MPLLTDEFTQQPDHERLDRLAWRSGWLHRVLTVPTGGPLTTRDRELPVMAATTRVDPGAAARRLRRFCTSPAAAHLCIEPLVCTGDLSTCPDLRLDLTVCDLERIAHRALSGGVMGMDLLAADKDLAPKGPASLVQGGCDGAVIERARTWMTTDPAIVWWPSSDQGARTVGRRLKADLPGQATALWVLTGERVVRYRVEPSPHPDATGPIHSALFVRTE